MYEILLCYKSMQSYFNLSIAKKFLKATGKIFMIPTSKPVCLHPLSRSKFYKIAWSRWQVIMSFS